MPSAQSLAISDLGCSLLSNQRSHPTVGHHQGTARPNPGCAAHLAQACALRCYVPFVVLRSRTTQILVACLDKISHIMGWEIIISPLLRRQIRTLGRPCLHDTYKSHTGVRARGSSDFLFQPTGSMSMQDSKIHRRWSHHRMVRRFWLPIHMMATRSMMGGPCTPRNR